MDRLLAHGCKAMTMLAALATGEHLEPAPEGTNMEAVEMVAVSLLQSQQLGKIACVAQVASELPRIERSCHRPWGVSSAHAAV